MSKLILKFEPLIGLRVPLWSSNSRRHLLSDPRHIRRVSSLWRRTMMCVATKMCGIGYFITHIYSNMRRLRRAERLEEVQSDVADDTEVQRIAKHPRILRIILCVFACGHRLVLPHQCSSLYFFISQQLFSVSGRRGLRQG